jgi:hypothetical protein
MVGSYMKPLAVAMILVLAAAGCISAPTPEQPVEADWAPCVGDGYYGDTKSYARCIKHVATLASPGNPGMRLPLEESISR